MRRTKTWKNYLTGYLFILPMVTLFAGFVIYPVIYNIIISFFEWNGISQTKSFVGLDNYKALFKDPVMARVMKNFLIFAFTTIIIQALAGLFFASILIRKIRFAEGHKTLIYLPIIATPAIVGNIFSKILETNRGYLNQTLTFLHLDFLSRQWLADPKLALGCIIFVNIWQWTGYSMLMYYANMLNISPDIYEASQIDGAGHFKQFASITFPLLRGTHYTVFIMGMIGSLKTFDIPYVLTNAGPNHATEFFSTYIYEKSFDLFDQGAASAIVVLMLTLAMLITALQLCFYYRNDKDKEAAG